MSVPLTHYIVQRSAVYVFKFVYVFKNEFLMIPIVPLQDLRVLPSLPIFHISIFSNNGKSGHHHSM